MIDSPTTPQGIAFVCNGTCHSSYNEALQAALKNVGFTMIEAAEALNSMADDLVALDTRREWTRPPRYNHAVETPIRDNRSWKLLHEQQAQHHKEHRQPVAFATTRHSRTLYNHHNLSSSRSGYRGVKINRR